MSEEKAVLVDVADGIMTITLNRPEAKNACNNALAEGVADAVDQLDGDINIRVAILTGSGGTFCSGMDLKAFVDGERPSRPERGFGGLTKMPPKKPLIAAVEGFALAGGMEMLLSCDLIVSADNAKFGIPEAKRGLAAAAGGLMRLPQQIPQRLAMEMALTGDFYTAEQVANMGLINKVVPAGTALDAAKELATKICANGPLAVQASKQVLVESREWSGADMWDKQQAIVDPVFASADAIEGATAFAQKRPPEWKGK